MRIVGQDRHGIYIQLDTGRYIRVMESPGVGLGAFINVGDDVEIVAEDMEKAVKRLQWERGEGS